MTIATVLGSGSRLAGGLFQSVRRGAQALVNQGWDVDVFALHDPFAEADAEAWLPIRPRFLPRRGPVSLGLAPAMDEALRCGDIELVHQHGIWQAISAQVSQWRHRTSRPVVISPRGMLDPWALRNASWRKRIARILFEDANLKGAAALHALNTSEAAAMRAFGLTNPIAVIPNGTDLPNLALQSSRPEWLSDDGRRALAFIGRIHPKKGVAELVRAWSLLKRLHPRTARRWRLIVAGWDDGGHLPDLKRLIVSLDLESDVLLPGPVFGDEKIRLLRSADAFILPSYSEGLPMAVLEAWAFELPVFMTRGCNLPEGFAVGAAVEIATNPEGLAAALAAHLDDDYLDELGRSGRALVAQHYTWDRVAKDYGQLYQWLQSGGALPAFVECQAVTARQL